MKPNGAVRAMAADDPASVQQKQVGGRFQPGRSGNPRGKKPGTKNRATLAAEALLDGEAEALTRKAIKLAKDGDVTALRLCLERLVPPRRERPVSVDLPPIATPADAVHASAAILAAVADGGLTLPEAAALLDLIGAHLKLLAAAPAAPANPADNYAEQLGRPVEGIEKILAVFKSRHSCREDDAEGRD